MISNPFLFIILNIVNIRMIVSLPNTILGFFRYHFDFIYKLFDKSSFYISTKFK